MLTDTPTLKFKAITHMLCGSSRMEKLCCWIFGSSRECTIRKDSQITPSF